MLKINMIINQSTFAGSHFKESLDLALVCAAFDHQVNLIFLADGVYSLVDNQQSQVLGEKNQADLLKGLSFYDIENVFVEGQSLRTRSLTTEQLLIDVVLLEADAVNQLNQQADQVVTL